MLWFVCVCLNFPAARGSFRSLLKYSSIFGGLCVKGVLVKHCCLISCSEKLLVRYIGVLLRLNVLFNYPFTYINALREAKYNVPLKKI